MTSKIYPPGSNIDEVHTALGMGDIHYLSQKSAKEAIALILTHLADWPIRTPDMFRNTLLGEGIIAINPMLHISDGDFAFLKNSIQVAVAEGRMIDFGFIPNAVLIEESIRARTVFECGELIHPYDSWIGISRWEGGCNGYYITPHPSFPGETLVVELYGVVVPNALSAVMVYDMVSIKINGQGGTTVSPARMTYPSHKETEADIRARGSNSLDPLVVMLRFLADASIPVERVEAPARLNKSRAKQGKFAIPDHTIVRTRDYIANFQSTASARGTDKGGHHASPVAHWRRAHKRQLATGRVVPVKSSKVNWRDAEELHRLFYKLDR
jgi:hypothetical protein